MPNYDYSCSACGHTLEAFQKITAPPLKTCPKCQKETLSRGFGGGLATFRFKGDGYYITDYCKGKDPANPSSCPCKSDN